MNERVLRFGAAGIGLILIGIVTVFAGAPILSPLLILVGGFILSQAFNGGGGTGTKKLPKAWIGWGFVVVTIGLVLWQPSREAIWEWGVQTTQTQVIGEVHIPYAMEDLGEGVTEKCLPQGVWKYEGVSENSAKDYRFGNKTIGWRSGSYGRSFSGIPEEITLKLLVKNSQLFGAILLQGDNFLIEPGGTILIKESCEKVKGVINLPEEYREHSYLPIETRGIILRFIRK